MGMTRLKEEDICSVGHGLAMYNLELVMKTGHTLAEIAAHAVGLSPNPKEELVPRQIAVIPMTCGLGVIGGFSQTVADILTFLGMNAFVTQGTDVEGMAEALERKAEILFMADDHRFIALHLKSGFYSDNSIATGKGYAAALDYMAHGLKGKPVLIIGAGNVGAAAARAVLAFEGLVHVYDKCPQASQALADSLAKELGVEIVIEEDLQSALKEHSLIMDCCPESEFIKTEHLTAESHISAPGVPLGVESQAISQVQARLIHDPLQLGVATMLMDILKQCS